MNWFKRIFSRDNQGKTEQNPNQSNAYDLIGGDDTIKKIAINFYQFMDSELQVKQLRDIHPEDLQLSEEKLYQFLSGWLGGPQLFQKKYGNPALKARHLPFSVDENMRDQWLMCMKHALAESVEILEHEQAIFQAISTLADHMRNKQN